MERILKSIVKRLFPHWFKVIKTGQIWQCINKKYQSSDMFPYLSKYRIHEIVGEEIYILPTDCRPVDMVSPRYLATNFKLIKKSDG